MVLQVVTIPLENLQLPSNKNFVAKPIETYLKKTPTKGDLKKGDTNL